MTRADVTSAQPPWTRSTELRFLTLRHVAVSPASAPRLISGPAHEPAPPGQAGRVASRRRLAGRHAKPTLTLTAVALPSMRRLAGAMTDKGV